MSRAYLDHASTSPLRPQARDAMVAWLEQSTAGLAGDPGRSHVEGLASRVAVETAREQVAAFLGARPREVVFCSGATEAIALASWGGALAERRHVVLSAVEHSAVRGWAERCAHTVVGVDRAGRVDPADLSGAITAETGLVHLQWANHEVGTLQPVTDIVDSVHDRGALLHVDAAAASGTETIDFVASGIDLLSVSAHKMGGPTGVGALLVRRGVRIPSLLVGGDQERARRGGLEAVGSIVGFGAAAEALAGTRDDERVRFRALTERVVRWARTLPGVSVLGDASDRLAHLVCLGFEDLEPQPVLVGLDRAGIAVHSGSSCSSEALEPSPVLAAMGVDANRSLRVSVGWSSTDADIDRLLVALPRVLDDLRSLRPT